MFISFDTPVDDGGHLESISGESVALGEMVGDGNPNSVATKFGYSAILLMRKFMTGVKFSSKRKTAPRTMRSESDICKCPKRNSLTRKSKKSFNALTLMTSVRDSRNKSYDFGWRKECADVTEFEVIGGEKRVRSKDIPNPLRALPYNLRCKVVENLYFLGRQT